jgi:hypothetical protein
MASDIPLHDIKNAGHASGEEGASRIFASLHVGVSIPGTREEMVKFEQPHIFLILIKEALARKISLYGRRDALVLWEEALIFLDLLVTFPSWEK